MTVFASATSAAQSKGINSSPTFDTQGGWGPGYALATGHGQGVVVGPGKDNPNVFAQSFLTKSGQQYRITARASSADGGDGMAAVQINWQDRNGQFVGVTQEMFRVTPAERTFEHIIVPPREARVGTLYVVPGGSADKVRYTEMTLSPLSPFQDFAIYRFFGVEGKTLATAGAVLLLCVVLWARYRDRFFRAAGGIFPLLAVAACCALFYFLEGPYEQHYDSAWHQGSAEYVMKWNEPSLSLGGNPLHAFGIQHLMNPHLSPTFLLGSVVPADLRIPVQAAFQALAIFAILAWICRLAGAHLADASAIALIAIFWLYVPELSGNAITLSATLGLLWQEAVLATLLVFFFYTRVGYGDSRTARLWPIAGVAATVLWIVLAFPVVVAFFTLATAGLCLGALAGSGSRQELLYKGCAAAGLAAALLLAGFHDYVLNLFLYTPQMYYKTLYSHDFTWLFRTNTSMLLAHTWLGGTKILVFYALAAVGAVLALRFGNGYTRRIVFGGLALEAAIHVFSAINAALKLVPMTFTYVELTGITIVALLAATTLWVALGYCLQAVAHGLGLIVPAAAGLVLSRRRR